jgi:hypothetical protein
MILRVSMRQIRSLVAVMTATLCVAISVRAADDEALKQDAVSRVVESHDPALSVNIGRVYVKQAALGAARDLLGERGKAAGLSKQQWNLNAPEWQSAEHELMQGVDELIQRKVTHPAWVKEGWSQVISSTLNGEQADEIAVHFESEGGGLQRQVIEWFVGELTLQTYTFTDRLRYGVPGSEEEMRDLQIVTYERKGRFPPIYDLTKYPDAVRFASTDPGVKYFKAMVIQGVHALHTHLESVANEARTTIRSRADLIEPHIANVMNSAGGAGQ